MLLPPSPLQIGRISGNQLILTPKAAMELASDAGYRELFRSACFTPGRFTDSYGLGKYYYGLEIVVEDFALSHLLPGRV